MNSTLTRKRNITPEQAVKILSKNGINIDKNDAQEMLELMYSLITAHFRENVKSMKKNGREVLT